MIVPPSQRTRIPSEVRGIAISGAFNLGLRVAGLGSTFLLGVLLARVLGPAEYGLYGLATSLAALAMSLALFGTPQLAVRELSVRKAQGDWAGIKYLTRKFGRGVAAISTLLATCILLGAFLVSAGDSKTMALALPSVILLLLMAATALLAAELRGLGLLIKGQAMEILVRPALVFAVALGLTVTGFRLTAPLAIWIQVFVGLFAVVVSFVWVRSALPKASGETRTATATPWLAAALSLGLVDILRQLDGTYGMVLVGWIASPDALGIFRVALACNVVVAMPVTILHIILAPRLAPLHKDNRKGELQLLLSRTSAILTASVLPIALGAWLIGEDAIAFVFGPIYAGAWAPLFILCLAQLSFALFGMGPILLAMCDGERALIKIYLASVGTAIICAVPLTMRFGAIGAASASIISNSLIGFLSWRYGRRQLGIDMSFLPLFRPGAAHI